MRVTENSGVHVDRWEKSIIHRDWAARPTWMTEFANARMLCSCVKLVFFLTVYIFTVKHSLPSVSSGRNASKVSRSFCNAYNQDLLNIHCKPDAKRRQDRSVHA
jgi:hypothetical protein